MGQALYRTISHTAHDAVWVAALTENAPKGIASNIDTLKKISMQIADSW
jgi:hypothetical protein